MAEELTMTAAAETAAETANDAAAAGVVDRQEESAPAAQEQQATATEQGAETDGQKAAQSRGVNTYQKGQRLAREANERAANDLMEYARSKGLQPKNAADALIMLKAQDKGVTPEEYLAEEKTAADEKERLVRESPLFKEMEADAKKYRLQQEMQADLAAIRAVDPTVESLEALGSDYMDLVAAGMSGLNAYYALKGMAAVKQAAAPAQPGKATVSTDTDRDFTSEELDRLTMKDLDDPKVYERAMRSMQNLKK